MAPPRRVRRTPAASDARHRGLGPVGRSLRMVRVPGSKLGARGTFRAAPCTDRSRQGPPRGLHVACSCAVVVPGAGDATSSCSALLGAPWPAPVLDIVPFFVKRHLRSHVFLPTRPSAAHLGGRNGASNPENNQRQQQRINSAKRREMGGEEAVWGTSRSPKSWEGGGDKPPPKKSRSLTFAIDLRRG